jgi:hypothetical protein
MTIKRVRIAVAITPDGNWSSCGWGLAKSEVVDDEELALGAESSASEGIATVYFIEADVPVPEGPPTPSTIEGEVTP